MSGLNTVALTVCCASLICALVSNFVTDGSMKKVLNLILGAFIICCLIMPVKAAVSGINSEYGNSAEYPQLSATDDEAYNKRVVGQTEENLEQTLEAILSQNGITPKDTEIILSVRDDNSIIISRVCIYIDKGCEQTELISELTLQNFGIKPNIITE